MEKDKFIGIYLDKGMKNHNLPYGLAYFNLLEEKTEKAERAWKRFCKKIDEKSKIITDGLG